MTLGISFEKAESMSAYDRQVWILALRQSNGEKFDWSRRRFIEPKVERHAERV